MIRRCLLILVALLAFVSMSAEEMDMIVLLDVSESMFPYFDDTVNFLLKDIVDEHLEYGDGFHLISFSGTPEREIYRVITSTDDMEAVLARIMLLHPLGKHTDLLFALDYLYDYVLELPLSTAKNILILTDGIQDPPPGSIYPSTTDAEREANRAAVVETATALKREGWKVRLIEFPRGEESLDEEDENDLFKPMAETLDIDVVKYHSGEEISHTATGAPSLEFPGDLGKVGSSVSVSFKVRNYRDEAVILKLEKIQSRGNNILSEPVQLKVDKQSDGTLTTRLDLSGFEPGEYLLEIELLFSDDLRIYPRRGNLSFTLVESNLARLRLPAIVVVIAAAAILLLIFVIIFLRRHIEHSADKESYLLLQPGRRSTEEDDASLVLTRRSRDSDEERQQEGAPGTAPAAIESRRGGTGKVPLMTAGSSGATRGKIPLSRISASHHAPDWSASGADSEQSAILGKRPIEFRLSGQNPYNAGRNIRWIGDHRRTVGGAGSYFLIFLVKVPEKIAEVAIVDGALTFTPIKHEFFPGLTGPLANCINQPIALHTDHGDFTMIFREWISPLERINRVLRLIDEPGTRNYPPEVG